jgi:hypothetical protein
MVSESIRNTCLISRFVSNKYLRPNIPGGQEVEWLYAFDIHCNAYFPLFMLLYVGQYILLPVLLMESSYLAVIISNTLYAVAFIYYFYVTFRGFVGKCFEETYD